jgi:hypothetical protein
VSVISRTFLPSMHLRNTPVISQHLTSAVYKRCRHLCSSSEPMRLLAASGRTVGIPQKVAAITGGIRPNMTIGTAGNRDSIRLARAIPPDEKY